MKCNFSFYINMSGLRLDLNRDYNDSFSCSSRPSPWTMSGAWEWINFIRLHYCIFQVNIVWDAKSLEWKLIVLVLSAHTNIFSSGFLPPVWQVIYLGAVKSPLDLVITLCTLFLRPLPSYLWSQLWFLRDVLFACVSFFSSRSVSFTR